MYNALDSSEVRSNSVNSVEAGLKPSEFPLTAILVARVIIPLHRRASEAWSN